MSGAFVDTPQQLLRAHQRLRASGFPILSLIAARTALDSRVWLGTWARARDVAIITAPVLESRTAMTAYELVTRSPVRQEPTGRPAASPPILLLAGPFVEALATATEILSQSGSVPVAVSCGLAEVVERLLDPATPMPLVNSALQGLVPVDQTDRAVLKTVAEGRRANPFLRGACEGLVYYMLQTRPQTKGRFEPNVRLPSSSDGRSHEVDLYCPDAKLIVEIDGVEHETSRRRSMDRKKQVGLEAIGYSVKRFTNSQVIEDPVGVWESIAHSLMLSEAAVD